MSRVYISSTFEDLKEHRQDVYHQLRRVGHDVVAMEDYVAQDQRPLANCLDDISGCDLYVGLFAWRYGYVPEDHNSRHLSITELEYRHAVDRGKECLVFLLDDNFAWPPPLQDSHTGNAEGGKLIRQLREQLSEKEQVAFFKTADHLASLVGAAVEKWGQKVNARKRDQASRRTIKQLTSDEKIVVDRLFGQTRLLVINDDICNAATDIVVSSDDNYFTARDGVSKLLLDKLGPSVRRELEHYRNAGFRQGQVAITTGGDWGRRAVIHAAVIDLDNDLYPTPEGNSNIDPTKPRVCGRSRCRKYRVPSSWRRLCDEAHEPLRLRQRHGHGDACLHKGRGCRRTQDVQLRFQNQEILVRNQAPLDPDHIELGSTETFEEYVACLNAHVFFWPGKASGPTLDGVRMFRRTAGVKSALIRVPSRSLLEANEDSIVHLSTCNTGASWLGEGKKSQRGIGVFQRAESFSEPPERIEEVSFRGSVNLPDDSECSTGIGQRWCSLFAQTNGRPHVLQCPSKNDPW